MLAFGKMKILMATPVPFFQPRGTPFSTLTRCKALTELGHEVVLLTYPIGDDIKMKGLRILRTWNPFFFKTVGLGLSLKMFILDYFLSWKFLLRGLFTRYDFLHAHEETVFAAVLLKKIRRKPLLYDMHSSIPQQLTNFRATKSNLLIKIMAGLENWAIRNSDAVIVICPDLEKTVKKVLRRSSLRKKDWPKMALIENLPVGYDIKIKDGQVKVLERKLHLKGKKKVVYTGTLAVNQGIELLIKAAKFIVKKQKDIKFVIVGGEKERIVALKGFAEKQGVGKFFMFTGKRHPRFMPVFERLADVLVSPRVEGTNTPLKIYSYMRSGTPIVATDLLTHTQVLDKTNSILTKVNPKDYAKGIIKALTMKGFVKKITKNAKTKIDKEYSYDSFINKTHELLEVMSERCAE